VSKEWYSPPEIWRHFYKAQIIWLMQEVLGRGEYPPSPEETGYTDAPINKPGVSYHAPFEEYSLLIAELEDRLKACGQHGEMAKARHCDGWDDERIARLAHCAPWNVNRSIKQAIWYMTGSDRRPCSYQKWQECGCPRWKDCKKCEDFLRVNTPFERKQVLASGLDKSSIKC